MKPMDVTRPNLVLTPRSAPPGLKPQIPAAPTTPVDQVTLERTAAEVRPEPSTFSLRRLILGALALVPLLGLAACSAVPDDPPPPPPSSINTPIETPTRPGPITPAPETPAPARVGVLMPVPQEGEGATIQVPEGATQILFEQGSVRAQDAQGHDLVVQPDWAGQVWTTSLSTPGQDLGMLHEGVHGEMLLKLPQGTRTVMIFPNQTTMDGSLIAMDSQGNVLGAHYNSDIQLLPLTADAFACARIEPFMTESRDGSVRLDLPAGTRTVHVNGAQAGNDGSLVAVDGYGRVLQLHPNWDGSWSTQGQNPTADPTEGRLVSGDEFEGLSLSVVPGTRRIEIRPEGAGTSLQELDASGNVLARQEGSPLVFRPGPL